MNDNNIVYKDSASGRVCFRASAFGGCDRALTAALLGYEPTPPPAKLQETYDAGHDAEDWLNTQIILTDQQREVRLDIPGTTLSIVGHIDGMIGHNVAEIKSQSPAEYDRWTEDRWATDPLWAKYAWQTSIYMYALATRLNVIRVRRREEGRDEKGRDYKYTIEYYPEAAHPLYEIEQRARYLASLTELPACTTTRAYGCPYFQLHEDTRELVEDDELDVACRNYNTAKTNERYAEELVREARAKVLKALRDRKDVATSGGWSVKHTTFATKEKHIPAGEQSRLTVSEMK